MNVRDTIDGGAGTDVLQLSAAEVANITSAAQFSAVTNMETVRIDTAMAGATNFTFLKGITTIEFDGGIGVLFYTVNSGTEIQYDLLTAGATAQTYTVTGTATTDTLE
jgi:hypothetical protein